MRKMTGTCLCGAVKLTVSDAHGASVGACHCRMCQRWSGGLFLCFTAEAEAVSVDGEVTRYASSTFAERAFCAACGTHLWMRDTQLADSPFDLMPGLFDAAADWPLKSEIYCDRALASVPLSGDHDRKTENDYQAANAHVQEGTEP